MELIPFDDDLLSLELETPYKECYLEGDRTSLYYVARSIMSLQSQFGVIPTLKGKGTSSKLIIDMLLRMRKEIGSVDLNTDSNIQMNSTGGPSKKEMNEGDEREANKYNKSNISGGTSLHSRANLNPEIDQLIIIDREVDMITPFCTQLTYEGKLNLFYFIIIYRSCR